MAYPQLCRRWLTAATAGRDIQLMKSEPPNSKLTAGFVSHRRGIGRLFGNGICPPIGGSFALADACAFGARFRMASAALWKAATAWSSALRR